MSFKFGNWIQYFFPVEKKELKKFIPMLLIFALIAFNYNLLKATKDTLIVTAPKAGAQAIPFIKVWILLPMAFFMTFIFTKLSNKHSMEKVFYLMISIFLSYFALFTFVFYPLREILHPSQSIDFISQYVPKGLHGFLAIFRYWIYTSFYVMSELWSTAILSVLFWVFANAVTTVDEAKRFYVLFGLGANITSILSGKVSIYLSTNVYMPFIPFGKTSWDQSVLFLNVTIIAVGFIIIGLFFLLNRKILQQGPLSFSFKNKSKASLKQSFAYLGKSKYLICIASIVVCYNLAINLVEVIWKNQLSQLLPNPGDYNAYMGKVMILTGIIATVIALFISGNILRKFSWTFNALIPPVIVFITGIFFFFFTLAKGQTANFLAGFFHSSPLILSSFFGSMQVAMSRASKYTLFDATKEISFIPLSPECKFKGKAAIDGVGSRIGKGGGSVVHQSLLLILSSLSATAPYIALIFLIILAVWILSLKSLGKQFNELTAQDEKISIVESQSNPEKALN